MNPVKVIEKMPTTYQVILTICAIFSVGFLSGTSLAGLTEVPSIAAANKSANARQDSLHAVFLARMDAVDARMTRTDRRITRLACLMTSEFEGTNPVRCDAEDTP